MTSSEKKVEFANVNFIDFLEKTCSAVTNQGQAPVATHDLLKFIMKSKNLGLHSQTLDKSMHLLNVKLFRLKKDYVK